MRDSHITRGVGWGLVATALLVGLASTGCGDGSGQTVVKVVVDGRTLPGADQLRVRSVWLFVTGDGEGGVIPQMYSTMGLPMGQYTAVYKPHVKTGTLDIMVTINDAAGAVIDSRTTTVMVRSGNQVVATVTFGADVDGGVGSIPPMGGGGNGGTSVDSGVLDAPGVGGSGAGGAGPGAGGAGAAGSGGGLTGADGSAPDVPGADAIAACAMMACSGTTADACCPTACTPLDDVDCAGCGNGKLDPGETCDPVQTCATSCPQMGCQLFTLIAPNTCQATCAPSGMQTMCVNGDGCCPSGCSTANDTDCRASCGNGVVDGQELCDGNCPSTCPQLGCQMQKLQGSAATCDAKCVAGGMQTMCANGDGCCPDGCTTANDSDCAVTCGNGKIDPGEICDGNCPTSCPPMGCTLRQLAGNPATCDASCVTLANPQMQCMNGDGCCPATGCNANNDNDCRPMCGNSVLEMGETCDPPSACMTAATACVTNANTIATMSGNPAQCTFVCTRTARTCGPADTYCPTSVTCGPTMDVDCPGCGNNKIETALGETCDPPSMCMTQMTACVSDKDNVRVSSGSVAACTYRCTTTTRTCGPADGFCPTGCGPTMDVDCPGCGNGKIEANLGENCDVAPAAVTCAAFSCADTDSCTTDTKTIDGNGCHVTCAHPPKTMCMAGDMCCPPGGTCNANNDADCGAVCGNGVVEGAEKCDPPSTCPTSCPPPGGCSMAVLVGSSATCTATCTTQPITMCSMSTKDGCCPGEGLGSCNSTNDADCAPRCGNGLLEAGETCETSNVPTKQLCSNFTCDDGNACTKDVITGSAATCDLRCVNNPITACSGQTTDGCCASTQTMTCNVTNDADCKAICGNGVVESPAETCDTGISGSCPSTCPPLNNCMLGQQLTVPGNACTAVCVSTGKPPACSLMSDGCCTKGCTDQTDVDCPPANDQCANAIDMLQGGDFQFDLTHAKQDTTPQCSAAAKGTLDVFYKFTLTTSSFVYLDVYNGGKDAAAAIELYQITSQTDQCAGLKIQTCDGGSGQSCGGGSWPRIFVAGAATAPGLAAGSYMVVVRAVGTPVGTETLRFQRVPAACGNGGALSGTNGMSQGSTCSDATHYAPTCTGPSNSSFDRAYVIEKCPGVALTASTCGSNPSTINTLQLYSGNMELNAAGACSLGSKATDVTCNKASNQPACSTDPSGLPILPTTISSQAGTERGLLTLVVDLPTNQKCGSYVLTYSLK